MKITFLGATKTVTGSNFLVETARKKVFSWLWNVSRKSNRRIRKFRSICIQC